MALALALHRQGRAATIFEARPRGAVREDKRILALSHGSRQILEGLGLWSQLAATPIAHIHVSQRGSFGRTRLSAAEEGLPALGYVVAAADLGTALDTALAEAGLAYRDQDCVERVDSNASGARLYSSSGETETSLVVYAEGSIENDADALVHDYGQSAVISSVVPATPHGNCAWERFTAQGPLALLPHGRQLALVYTCAPPDAELLALLDDEEFLARLQEAFGHRLRFTGATPRQVYPLRLRYRRSPVATRALWLGNAAQTLHPVGGQGFNLALRDVAQLARLLAPGGDPGDAELLARYAASRRLDRIATIRFTDALARAFVLDLPLAAAARGAGLLALDLLPPLRSFLARRMVFGARAF